MDLEALVQSMGCAYAVIMHPTEFQFERFTDTGKSFAARVAIRQNGQLGLNEGARNQFSLQDRSHAILFYDRGAQVVGMRFTNNDSEEGAIPLRVSDKNSFIPAKQFLEKYGIEYRTGARRFALQKHGEIVYFRLGDQLSGSNRKDE